MLEWLETLWEWEETSSFAGCSQIPLKLQLQQQGSACSNAMCQRSSAVGLEPLKPSSGDSLSDEGTGWVSWPWAQNRGRGRRVESSRETSSSLSSLAWAMLTGVDGSLEP